MDEIKAKPVVWIINSQQWSRANLRALLLDRGFDAIGFIELHQALASLKDPHCQKPHIILLELHDLLPTEEELDTVIHLSVPIVGVAGAVEIGKAWIKKVRWAALIQRPVRIGQVVDVIEGLMGLSMKRL